MLWAAVYLNGTAHSTHVHEQSVCRSLDPSQHTGGHVMLPLMRVLHSGVFYSQVADEAPTPIEFSDPRGACSL